MFTRVRNSEALCRVPYQVGCLQWGVVSPSPNIKDGGPPVVGCPQLRIQYIRS